MKKTYKMKKIHLILIIFLNSLIITSQNDPKAEELLNKVSENIKTYESMYININHNPNINNNNIDIHINIHINMNTNTLNRS